jgi:hypothetical protein
VDPKSDLDDVEMRTFLTLPGLEFRPLGRSVGSQSTYRLHYPGSLKAMKNKKKISCPCRESNLCGRVRSDRAASAPRGSYHTSHYDTLAKV